MKISVEEEAQYEPEVVEDDVYVAEVSGVNQKEFKHGPTVILEFEITQGSNKGARIPGFTSAKLNPRTKLWEWTTLLGFKLKKGEDFETDDLIGKPCRIVTETNTVEKDDGETYKNSRVVKILPAE